MSLSNSKVEHSAIAEDFTLNDEKDFSQGTSIHQQSTPNLSITLNHNEKLILNGKNHSLNTPEKTKTNGFSVNIKNSLKENVGDKKMTTEILTNNEKENETVISVEEDGEDVMEINTLESTYIETPQKEMFAHLQPKNSIEIDEGDQNEAVLEEYELSADQHETELFQNPLIEVGRKLWSSTVEKQQYTKGCLWSPDGTCLLVPVHLDGMHVFELPTDLYLIQELSTDRDLSNLTSAVHVKEGGTVYDYCWYPFMDSVNPASCCWIATRQHEPIHMWDAFTGELRCSYRGYDDVDEVESAISVIFSNDAEKVIGGYKKSIKVFDTHIPGRNCTTIKVKNAVSCFALSTDNDNCITAGSWAGYINHYDLRAPKLGPLFTLGGHCGGITWLKYVPTAEQNWYLFSGARKDNRILQWDMRNYTEPMQIFERNVETNQRIYFDLSPFNNWLASGDTQGLLKVWNLGDKNQQFELPLHNDCCNGVSIHPTLPIIATTSGQFHITDITHNDSTEKIIDYENSLLLMWYGPSIST